MLTALPLDTLRDQYGDRLQTQVALARYSAARVGGPADALLPVDSAEELRQAAVYLWQAQIPFVILGGGSNVLISDAGIRELVILNRAKAVRFSPESEPPTVWAESGTNFGMLARQAAGRGLSGLEWAAGIPGTLGGAIYGNAGAHGSDMRSNLRMAEILHQNGKTVEADAPMLDLSYRSSALKRSEQPAVILAATLELANSEPAVVQARMEEFKAFRRRTQPPGASMGSMFKNPPGDYAGRLIEAAGLKGTRVGDAQISELHANFFVNLGQARAEDIYKLIQLAKTRVLAETGIELALEIQLLGAW